MNRKALEVNTKRQFILDAARELFAEKGIDNCSMEDIAKAVDYTRRTIYAYFASFDEIAMRVFLDDQQLRWDEQVKVIADIDTGLEKLKVWAETLYKFCKENHQYIKLELYWDYHGIDINKIDKELFRLLETRNNEMADGMRAIFRLGIEDGSMRPDLTIDTCISQFLYSMRAIINRALSPGYTFAPIEADSYVSHYIELFCLSIKNSKGESG